MLKKIIFEYSKKWGDRIGLDLPYFVKNGFWVAVRQGVGMVSGLALSIAFARLATQEVFGQYQFILSVLSIVSILSIPGLNTSITQSVARGYDGDYERVVKTSFLWSLLGIPTLLIIGGYYYVFQNHSLGIAFMIASIFFPFFYAPNTWDAFLQGKGRFDVSAKYASIQAILNVMATITVIFLNGNNLILIVITYLISYTLFNGYYYFKSLHYVENDNADNNVMGYGFFLTKINALTIVTGNIDKLIIGIMLSIESLAIYSVISLVAIKFKDILKPLFGVFFPKISKSKLSLRQLILSKKKSFLLLIIASFCASLIFLLVIEWIDEVFFGEVYNNYYYLSKYFSMTVFIIPILHFLGIFAQARMQNKAIFFSNTIYSTLKIPINIFFVYKWGIVGAVFAYNFTILLWLLLYLCMSLFWEDKKILHLDINHIDT